MFVRCLNRYTFTRISENLKLLNLKLPTTQQQIKTRYRQLAKQYHPDTIKQQSNKQAQQNFVKITTAYNYLKQLEEKELTAEAEQYDINMPQDQKEKVRTKQEELRQQTYDYFRRKDFYAQKKKDPAQDKPLYKTIPELFIGTAFMVVLFGEWVYKTTMKTNKQYTQVKKKQELSLHGDVFKGFNSAKKFSRQSHHSQVLTAKDEKNLRF